VKKTGIKVKDVLFEEKSEKFTFSLIETLYRHGKHLNIAPDYMYVTLGDLCITLFFVYRFNWC